LLCGQGCGIGNHQLGYHQLGYHQLGYHHLGYKSHRPLDVQVQERAAASSLISKSSPDS